MKCRECGDKSKEHLHKGLCNICVELGMHDPAPGVKTLNIKIPVRVGADGSWIVEGMYELSDGTCGRCGMVDILGAPYPMDSTVIVEAEIPIPERGNKTVQGTVAP